MQVLVVGGAGFLGAHLVSMLVAHGHVVTVLDNLSRSTLAHVDPDAEFIHADIRVPLDAIFLRARPEVVLHLAAQTSVADAVADPAADLEVNIRGTVHVMNAAAAAGSRKVVFVSSAAVYGAPERLPLTEAARTMPLSPYGLSKRTAEAYVRMLGNQHGLAYTILRPANIYGPRQSTGGEGAVVSAFLQRFLSGQDPVIHGDGGQSRDFLYVTDAAAAAVQTLHHGDGLTLNVSTGVGISVWELWHELAGLLHWPRPPVFGPARAGDIAHSVLANHAARLHLGWQPRVPLAVGLAETVAYVGRRVAM